MMTSPGTPAWLKKSLVRMKSLDYRFSDDNTAIYTKKQQQLQKNQQQFQAKKLDAHAYRQKILESRKQGGLATSAGHMVVDADQLHDLDVTKSPGFKREKHMDKQRKRESMKITTRRGSSTSDSSSPHDPHLVDDSSKSSFSQCTFNMANILMGVGMLGLPFVFKSAGWIGGFCVTIGFCLVTWQTSYYLGRVLNGDPRPVHLFDGSDLTIKRLRKPMSSFPEIAREAFGDNGCIVSILCCCSYCSCPLTLIVVQSLLFIVKNSPVIAFFFISLYQYLKTTNSVSLRCSTLNCFPV
jgi:hypothetical protein